MESKTIQGGFLDDAASLEAIVAQLTPQQQMAYQRMGALTLVSAFPNRRMVIYTLRNGLPEDISMLLLGDIEMTRIGGPKVTITDGKGTVIVGVTPQRWRDRELFLHVPQNFIFKWKGKYSDKSSVHFVPHYAILYKTRSKEHLQVEGDTYAVTFNDFKTRFPQQSLRY